MKSSGDIGVRICDAILEYKRTHKGMLPKRLLLGHVEMRQFMRNTLDLEAFGVNVREQDCESMLRFE
jgi:hypothetical protein